MKAAKTTRDGGLIAPPSIRKADSIQKGLIQS